MLKPKHQRLRHGWRIHPTHRQQSLAPGCSLWEDDLWSKVNQQKAAARRQQGLITTSRDKSVSRSNCVPQETSERDFMKAWSKKGWNERRWFRCVLTWSLLSKAAVAPSPLFSSTTTTMWVREFTLTCSISRSSCRSWNTGTTQKQVLMTVTESTQRKHSFTAINNFRLLGFNSFKPFLHFI